MGIGNSFIKKTISLEPAQRVWREIYKVYPGGGVITANLNFTDVIPAGTPCKLAANTITVYANSEVEAAKTQINGFLAEDVYLAEGVEKYTGTVVYEGEMYKYMVDSTALTHLEGAVPGVKFVE